MTTKLELFTILRQAEAERDELRAELETVRGALATEMRFHDQAVTENERLRARVAELEAMVLNLTTSRTEATSHLYQT